VALTGWGQERDRRRAWAAGFDHHLTKPVDPVQIEALLAESIEEAKHAVRKSGAASETG